MYPKNSASPPRIYVGPVVQISDGAVQTSGVAITVTGEGGAETAGGGTVAYSTKGGVWYTPTQAETNYSAFMVEASKTGCIPAGVTVVTTLSATSGQVVCADTQKVDLNTIKTQAVTCAAGVTVPATIASATNIQRFSTGITAAVDADSPDINTPTVFKTTLASAVDDFYKDCLLLLTSGDLSGQVKKVTAYNGTTKYITVSGGFTGIPAIAVTLLVVNQ